MADPASEPEPAPAADLPARPSWRARTVAWFGRARKPVIAVAAVGTVLSGLVGYWTTWRAVQGGATVTAVAPASTGAQRTIAVLPFASIGGDKGEELFADGVTDELISLLARVSGLRVTPRVSSFYFKGKSVPAAEAASRLGVSYLVDGSVRRSGERVRISAQLVSASDGAVLWSRTLDRDFTEMLAAQADIALGIAGSLTQSLDRSVSFAGRTTASPEAWDAFLRAQSLPEGQRVPAYERVLALDPKFARVHVAIAEELLGMVWRGKLRKAEASERMNLHLEQALRIDPRYDHAHGLLGAAARIVDDMDALRRVAQRALEADPESSAGHGWTAELNLREGDMAAALPAYKRSLERVPLVGWAYLNYAQALRLANQPALALQAADQALALDPDSRRGLAERAHALRLLGRRDEALRIARERDMPTLLMRYGTSEDQAAMRQRKNLDSHAAAWQQFLLGRPDAVVEHLETDHSSDIQDRNPVLFDDEYDPVRELASFKAWLAKHKLTEAHERAQAWRAANPVPRN